MTNLSLGSDFISGVTTKGNRISILAFEVANTVVKGSNLMQSLLKDNIKHLKEAVLPSKGVQNLISRDMDELLRIAAADKRLGSELTPQKKLKEEAETIIQKLSVIQQLMTMVHHTTELYHELHALDRFEQDYRRLPSPFDNEFEAPPGCHCKKRAVLRTSSKPWSMGRRFYGCPYYRGKNSRHCDFFQWFDEEMFLSDRAIHFFMEMMVEREARNRKIAVLKHRLSTNGLDVDDEVVGDLNVEDFVDFAIGDFKKKCEKIVEDAMKKMVKWVVVIFIIAIVVVVSMK